MSALDPITGITNLGSKILDIVDQYVEDKDASLKVKSAVFQATLDFALSIQTGEHVPTGVKYLYALRDVVLPLLRPVGAAAMSGFAAYAAYKGIEIDPAVNAAMAAAFPGWMYSRHVTKVEAEKTVQEEKRAVVRVVERATPEPKPVYNHPKPFDPLNPEG